MNLVAAETNETEQQSTKEAPGTTDAILGVRTSGTGLSVDADATS